MELLPISVGQAGNQINYQLANLFLNSKEELDVFKTSKGLMKNFLVDTESKVINKNYLQNNFSNFYYDGINLIKSDSGRGNNWALGYSLEYKEYSKKSNNNICIESYERINQFLEKCDFMKGFLFIHSLNGGTGSGVSTRLIEMLRDEFPKFTLIDCPVFGFKVENTSLSEFNKFFTFGHIYENVDQIFVIKNENFKMMNNIKFDYVSMNKSIAHVLYNFLLGEKKNRANFKFYDLKPNIKFVEILRDNFNAVIDNGINFERISKLLAEDHYLNKLNNFVISLDTNFYSNSSNFNSAQYTDGLLNMLSSPIRFSSYDNIDKSLRNNHVVFELFVKNKNYKYMIDNMLDRISAKMKSR